MRTEALTRESLPKSERVRRLIRETEGAITKTREHPDQTAIAKLKSNQPLTQEDIKSLENIL